MRPFRVDITTVYIVTLSANMTSSKNPEVHKTALRRQRKTEPRTWLTCIKKLGEDRRWIAGDTIADTQRDRHIHHNTPLPYRKVKGKGSPYSITRRRVPELIPVLGRQPAGDVSHKPGGRLPLLSAKPAVTPATLKRAATSATSFAAW